MAIFSRKARPTIASTPTPPAGGLEERTLAIGTDLLKQAQGHKAGLLSAKFYSDKLMDWSMKDQGFKVQLFRFVDAFPMLRSAEAVHEHLVDYLTQPDVRLPPGMDIGLKAGGMAKGLMTSTISGQIKSMAAKFIAGTDAESALPGLRDLWKEGIAFSVDLLGEACVSDAEADEYRDKYLDLVKNLPERVSEWKAQPRLESDHLGSIPRTNVSIKISSLSAKCNPIDTEGAIADLMTRIVPILEEARARDVFINFDMEQFALKDLTLELFMRCCEAVDFRAGLAMQAYLKSGVDDAKRIADWAKRTGRVVTVRLVKGAYWDYETIHAEEMGWLCPVWNEKWQSDKCFEDMTDVFLDSCPRALGGQADATAEGPTRMSPGAGGVKLALGSHNVRSIAHAVAALDQRGLPRNAIELQMLHGMADQLKHAASDLDLRVREYVPVGEMIPGMAYLVRRLLENTSNESWLRSGFLDKADPSALLAAPERKRGAEEKLDLAMSASERHALSRAEPGVGDGRAFVNEALRDFSRVQVRDIFAGAVHGAQVPVVASDKTPEEADAMVERALSAFNGRWKDGTRHKGWRDIEVERRARVLVNAAAAMRARRDELSGIIIKENGKCWVDADADVAEAIDFCEYYAREAVHLFRRERIGRFIGELDEQFYQPRGVAVVISPWNFPLAIACGMTAAALVTGNTVILKPAEQTAGIAKVAWEILSACIVQEISMAEGANVLQFCPAPGETTGAALVRDPRVSLLAFTGSKAVGLDIIKAAGVTHEEQTQVKKVVCEMGGKNAIIIDTSADLDEAVLGVRHSAFGFQGQKCSACSRCIVVDPDGPEGEATKLFVKRLVESTRSLVVGDPTRSGTDVGPIIDKAAAEMIRGMIETARAEGCREELAMDAPPADSSTGTIPTEYVGPHIFSHVEPHHTIARQEIFGPVLAVMHAKSFEEALAIANDHPYKLTGGVFSRKPSHLEQAKREFRVGNLYLNRGCTGALVARQPFGGFGMSGVGSKAGGKDYLLQFVEPRAICENTMRRGFAPEL
ncbi:MAG: proline dehydrogenase family protein [Phycisphaerales bacterium JB054]